jgi:tRNA A-37 threonylcarbamoyl transferase component Bud32
VEAAMTFAIGENVGPYRILEQLGQGGMATVYKAYHPALDRYVAIKVLHTAFLEDPNFLARFHREAKVVARLDHPNIVPIYDFAEHKGQPYLVMKFIQGETLKARLARGPLSRSEALSVAGSVGSALSFAHKRGILHRDVKPSNIILTPDGSIYLADFGLARIAESGESTLSADMMMGTPHYISPEQAKGERRLDEGTDIYSLGVVLYEIAVGRVPFSSDTPFSIIHDHIYSPLPLPRAVNPRVPEPVQAVLLKALEKARENRFATVDDLVAAFQAAAAGTPAAIVPDATTVTHPAPTRPALPPEETVAAVEIEPAPAPPATTPGSGAAKRDAEQGEKRRSRTWVWAAGGLALTCVCLLAFAWAANRQDRQETPAAPLYLSERGDPPLLAEARQAVEARPDDPEAHLDLASAYHAREMDRQAALELLGAGQLFGARGAHPEALRAYADALVIRGGHEGAEPEVVDGLQRAVFLGAPDERTWEVVERLLGALPAWDPLIAATSRTRLFQGRNDEARSMAEDVLSRAPQDAVAMTSLLEALLKSQDRAALEVARTLRSLPQVPEWLRPHLEMLLQSIPGM